MKERRQHRAQKKAYVLLTLARTYERQQKLALDHAFYMMSNKEIDNAAREQYSAQQSTLNQCLLQTFATVNAELELKMKQKAVTLKQSQLQRSKLKLAEVIPKVMFKAKLRAIKLWK